MGIRIIRTLLMDPLQDEDSISIFVYYPFLWIISIKLREKTPLSQSPFGTSKIKSYHKEHPPSPPHLKISKKS